MTQNGPYPGPPSQPWNNRGSSDEPYTEPADPWGDHPTAAADNSGWAHHQSPAAPPVADTGFSTVGPQPNYAAPPQPAWSQPAPPPRKRNTPIVALVIVLGLLICGGLGTTAWLLSGRGEDDGGQGATVDPIPSATTQRVTDPEPRSSEDARFVTKGQCVRNEGTPGKPDMKIVACATGTFEVLKRVDGRTTGETDAESKCNRVPEYTKWYFYDSELDSLDFVLCLKER